MRGKGERRVRGRGDEQGEEQGIHGACDGGGRVGGRAQGIVAFTGGGDTSSGRSTGARGGGRRWGLQRGDPWRARRGELRASVPSPAAAAAAPPAGQWGLVQRTALGLHRGGEGMWSGRPAGLRVKLMEFSNGR